MNENRNEFNASIAVKAVKKTKQKINLNSVMYFLHLYLLQEITYYFVLRGGICMYLLLRKTGYITLKAIHKLP
jgi:hypothetical protein